MSEKAIEAYEKQLREAQNNVDAARLSQAQQELMNQEGDRGMLAEQLEVGDLLDRLHNLLKGYVLTRKDGKYVWFDFVNSK